MAVVEPQGPDHWFEELADHMGVAYLRYSFTKGTVKEVDELLRRVPLDRSAHSRRRLWSWSARARARSARVRRPRCRHQSDVHRRGARRRPAECDFRATRRTSDDVHRRVRPRVVGLPGSIRHERRSGGRAVTRSRHGDPRRYGSCRSPGRAGRVHGIQRTSKRPTCSTATTSTQSAVSTAKPLRCATAGSGGRCRSLDHLFHTEAAAVVFGGGAHGRVARCRGTRRLVIAATGHRVTGVPGDASR